MRPEAFATAEELQAYLKKIRDYYAVLGRPRFGRSIRQTNTLKDASDRLAQNIDSLTQSRSQLVRFQRDLMRQAYPE